jgi:hypothetical protein
VLNQINPDFIRVRTLAVAPTSQLYKKQQQGEFKPLPDDDIIREEALFIEHLDGIESYFYSDHILNLLEEISGKLPDDKPVMKKTINNYLSLPDSEREIFRLGRRTGYYRFLNDLNNRSLRTPVETIYRQLQNKGVTVDDYIEQLKLRFV